MVLMCALVIGLLPCMAGAEIDGFFTSTADAALELFVSTDGNDSNPGTENEPFATIEGARNAIRALQTKPSGGIVVYIRGGYYSVTDSIRFTSEDSGTEDCPITYCAYDGEDVVISGGVTLDKSKFKKVSGAMKNRLRDKNAQKNVLVLDLREQVITDVGVLYEEGQVDGAEIFLNGDRMVLARYPNKGQYTCLLGKVRDDGRRDDLEWNEFGGATSYYSEKDSVIDEWSADAWKGGFVVGYLSVDYFDNVCKLMGVDQTEKTFDMGPGGGDYNNYRDCYFENIYDELDVPGEYYIDRETMLLYVYPTDDFMSSELTVSQCTKTLLVIDSADHLTFKGLHFEATRVNAIEATGNDLTFDGNRITGIRRDAIHVNGNRIYIINNYINDMGHCGIVFRGGDDRNLIPSESYIDNNTITNFGIYGKTYQAALDIVGNGIVISHNEIAYAPHEAIEYSGQNIIFEYNRIHNVCRETSDAGAIYSGKAWYRDSCIIRYNFIYDIHNVISIDSDGTEQGHPHGIYWDDAISGQVAYGNIIFDIRGNGFHIGGGHNNVVYNNIIVATGDYNIEQGMGFAIAYDKRAAAGGWASALIPYNSTSSMWTSLGEYPYTEKLWQYKFPVLALLEQTNFNDESNFDVGGNNSYAIVRNNIIAEKKTAGLFEGKFAVHSTIRDNVVYKSRYDVGFVDCDNLNFTLSPDSRALFDLAHFEVVDCAKIGLRK